MKRLATIVLALWFGSFSSALTPPSDDSPRFNLRTNPFNLLALSPNLDLDIKWDRRFTLGPVIGLLRTEPYSGLVSTRVFNVGLRANISFQGDVFENGWIFSPLAAVGFVDPSTGIGSPVVEAGAVIGYQSFVASGFNLGLGIGLQTWFGSEAATSPIMPIVDFNAGWRF